MRKYWPTKKEKAEYQRYNLTYLDQQKRDLNGQNKENITDEGSQQQNVGQTCRKNEKGRIDSTNIADAAGRPRRSRSNQKQQK